MHSVILYQHQGDPFNFIPTLPRQCRHKYTEVIKLLLHFCLYVRIEIISALMKWLPRTFDRQIPNTFLQKTFNNDGASFFFPIDQHKTKIINTLQLLLNYGSRFTDKSI